MENKSKQEAIPQSDSIEKLAETQAPLHSRTEGNQVYHTADINVDKYQAQSPSKPKLLIKEDILK